MAWPGSQAAIQAASLETRLNAFDPAVRAKSLADLAATVRDGLIEPAPETDVVNMHCHTFFSFNA